MEDEDTCSMCGGDTIVAYGQDGSLFYDCAKDCTNATPSPDIAQ